MAARWSNTRNNKIAHGGFNTETQVALEDSVDKGGGFTDTSPTMAKELKLD